MTDEPGRHAADAIFSSPDPVEAGKLAQMRKAIAAGIGMLLLLALAVADALGDVLPSQWRLVLTALVAVLTTLGTYLVPNAKKPATG